MDKPAATYHIIGGGIAGLSCARFLKEKNPSANTIIYEASDKLGGRCYSFEDGDLDTRLDNATHVIIGANKNAASQLGQPKWEKGCLFWDAKQDTVSRKFYNYRDLIFKSMCNLSADYIAPKIIKTIWRKTFPWTSGQRRIYFSKQDLSQRLINPLQAYADEIRLNSKLLKIDTQFGRAVSLTFNNRQLDLGANDAVILALNARAYQTIMGGAKFDYCSIVNIIYRTSQTLSLPHGANMLAIANGSADWVFCSNKLVNVTISDADNVEENLEELARKVWKELDIVRGVNSGFVPPFKVFKHKTATIRQDALNNSQRPVSAQTRLPNVFAAGDWTMKDYPCCIESAILSAKRAAKAARETTSL